jgi:hypothetical protein
VNPVVVRVSYGARAGCTIAIGATIILLWIALLIADLVRGGTDAPSAAAHAIPCPATLSGTLVCDGRMPKNGQSYVWKVIEAGTYTTKVKRPTGTQPAWLNVSKLSGPAVGHDAGSNDREAIVTAQLAPGDYFISLSDLLQNPAGADPGFRLTIEKKGGSAATPPKDSSKPVNPGMFAFPLLGLIFLAIPLLFLIEKAKIPLSIDPTGVTMRNGFKLPWNEYRGIVPITERVGRYASREIEVGIRLLFMRGSADLRYRPITNWAELGPIVNALKAGRLPWG